jgi:uncharacterized protein (TIGR02246 family)
VQLVVKHYYAAQSTTTEEDPLSQPTVPRTATAPEQVSLEFAQAVSVGDLDAASGFFAEDACFLAADGGSIHGRQAIREVLEQLLANRPTMEVEIKQMVATPRSAVGSERWTMHLQAPDGASFEQSGDSTVVFGRTDDGWEILIDAPWGL